MKNWPDVFNYGLGTWEIRFIEARWLFVKLTGRLAWLPMEELFGQLKTRVPTLLSWPLPETAKRAEASREYWKKADSRASNGCQAALP